MSAAEELRDYMIGLLCAQAIEEAVEGMKKTHKQFNTRLGFPVVLCCPHRMALIDNHIAGWHKSAPMTNVLKDVTCKNCIKELEKLS